MKVSIVNIGDELLIGQVVNTNASTMARMLTQAGMDVNEVVIVPDRREAIMDSICRLFPTSDALLLTGGLGPTKDDITKKVLCEFFGSRLVESETALDNVRRIFATRGYELTPVNREQALVPECCKVLNNDLGTAPCMWFESTGNLPVQDTLHVLVSLPGVPFEMEWLMVNRVIPKLRDTFNTTHIITKNILVQGIGESFLSDLIEPWELALPSNIGLAYLPQAGMVKLRLTAHGDDLDRLQAQISNAVRTLYPIAGKYIAGEDCESLSELVHKLLIQWNLTLSTAESCTGGTIASRLTAIPGASAYFLGGVVAYSNEVKESALGVKHKTLTNYGAVSEQTAIEMAEGARRHTGSDYAIATTGIAGPDGGTPEKPVGTVWIAVAGPQRTEAKLLQFGANRRQQNIDRSTNQAYAMLIRLICQNQ